MFAGPTVGLHQLVAEAAQTSQPVDTGESAGAAKRLFEAGASGTEGTGQGDSEINPSVSQTYSVCCSCVLDVDRDHP